MWVPVRGRQSVRNSIQFRNSTSVNVLFLLVRPTWSCPSIAGHSAMLIEIKCVSLASAGLLHQTLRLTPFCHPCTIPSERILAPQRSKPCEHRQHNHTKNAILFSANEQTMRMANKILELCTHSFWPIYVFSRSVLSDNATARTMKSNIKA